MVTLADCIHVAIGDPPCSACRRENWEQETSRTLTMLTAVLKDVSDRIGTLEAQPSAPKPEAGAVPCSICRQLSRRFPFRVKVPNGETRICVPCTQKLVDAARGATIDEGRVFSAADFGIAELPKPGPGGAEA